MNSRNPALTHSSHPTAFGPAELMLLMVAAIWGSSYALTKQATQQLPVLDFLALRFGLTFLVLLPALKPLLDGQARAGLSVGGLLGANLLAIFLCETFGVSLTSAANAAFLISLCVVLTPLAEWWLLGQRPAAALWWAAGASLLGVALLAAPAASDVALNGGDALMLLAAVLRAVLVCLTQKLAGRHRLPALTLTAVQTGVMALGALALSLSVHGLHRPDWPTQPGFWLSIGFLVLFCTVFAFYAQNHAARRTTPTRVALLTGSEPAFGALVAVLGLGESLSAWGWAGGGLIVVATGVVALRRSM